MGDGNFPSTLTGDELLSRDATAAFLQISPRTLDRWHVLGVGPRRFEIGVRLVRYRLASVNAWICSQERRRVPIAGDRRRGGVAKVTARRDPAIVSALIGAIGGTRCTKL